MPAGFLRLRRSRACAATLTLAVAWLTVFVPRLRPAFRRVQRRDDCYQVQGRCAPRVFPVRPPPRRAHSAPFSPCTRFPPSFSARHAVSRSCSRTRALDRLRRHPRCPQYVPRSLVSSPLSPPLTAVLFPRLPLLARPPAVLPWTRTRTQHPNRLYPAPNSTPPLGGRSHPASGGGVQRGGTGVGRAAELCVQLRVGARAVRALPLLVLSPFFFHSFIHSDAPFELAAACPYAIPVLSPFLSLLLFLLSYLGAGVSFPCTCLCLDIWRGPHADGGLDLSHSVTHLEGGPRSVSSACSRADVASLSFGSVFLVGRHFRAGVLAVLVAPAPGEG